MIPNDTWRLLRSYNEPQNVRHILRKEFLPEFLQKFRKHQTDEVFTVSRNPILRLHILQSWEYCSHMVCILNLLISRKKCLQHISHCLMTIREISLRVSRGIFLGSVCMHSAMGFRDVIVLFRKGNGA